jgi:putative transposase
MGRPKDVELVLWAEDRAALERLARSHQQPYERVRRAQVVLASATGQADVAIARRFGVSRFMVAHWRRRYAAYGLEGLSDAPRPGRARQYGDERISQLLQTVLKSPPPDGTHWSVRQAAAATGIPKSTVHRTFELFALKPHRQEHFRRSPDPEFAQKVREILGLYLNPPDKALVLCVDEKSQIQAM